jgi:hypothetical protein
MFVNQEILHFELENFTISIKLILLSLAAKVVAEEVPG